MRFRALLLLLALAACSPDAPAGSITADEDRQLNAAAASLDANTLDPGDEE
jgi:hypothetical protein